MNVKDRKKLLIDKDLTITKLAKKVNRSRVWIWQVLNDHERPRTTQEAIAKELGVPVEKLFPLKKKAA
jgi:transcriptional regulator with XRE-family HTH domain